MSIFLIFQTFSFFGGKEKQIETFSVNISIAPSLPKKHTYTKKGGQLIESHPHETFYVMNGNRVLIKRTKFEEYLDQATTV